MVTPKKPGGGGEGGWSLGFGSLHHSKNHFSTALKPPVTQTPSQPRVKPPTWIGPSSSFSRGHFPILSRDPSFQKARTPQKTCDRLLKRTMVEKNGIQAFHLVKARAKIIKQKSSSDKLLSKPTGGNKTKNKKLVISANGIHPFLRFWAARRRRRPASRRSCWAPSCRPPAPPPAWRYDWRREKILGRLGFEGTQTNKSTWPCLCFRALVRVAAEKNFRDLETEPLDEGCMKSPKNCQLNR